MFQEDLQALVKGSISEKSFYSYFKNDPNKLPRIDVLNLLSQYSGYTNWSDFKIKNTIVSSSKKSSNTTKWKLLIFGSICAIILIYFLIPKSNSYSFCFIDHDRNQPITNTIVDIIILNNKQSPFYTKSDSSGCFSWKTKDDFIHFVIQSPYHKTDTIYRTTEQIKNEHIQIKTDDYALMLHYYANGKVKNWKNRRKELNQLIANNAIIFQILPHGLGIEIYSKSEFIDKLTTPTKSLKEIEIIESQRSNKQIVKLKFKVKL